MSVVKIVQEVTDRIAARSATPRSLSRSHRGCASPVHRAALPAVTSPTALPPVQSPSDKAALAGDKVLNLGIVTSYNDMLSAHQPLRDLPRHHQARRPARSAAWRRWRAACRPCATVSPRASPAWSFRFLARRHRHGAGIALSHNMFDAAVYLGICDKIVPGLMIGALTFGHLPAVFIPAGPMTSGLPNDEKAKVRQLYAEGKVGRAELLESRVQILSRPGTCTFYGTANSNQMLMEIMGLHMPGASFVNPGTPLRDALTREAAKRALALTALGNAYTPVGHMIDERSIVNGVVGLHATGGSTNHTIHLIAMAPRPASS
jgi:phosphogluconate dehydratase